jgi:hypothetical protein
VVIGGSVLDAEVARLPAVFASHGFSLANIIVAMRFGHWL